MTTTTAPIMLSENIISRFCRLLQVILHGKCVFNISRNKIGMNSVAVWNENSEFIVRCSRPRHSLKFGHFTSLSGRERQGNAPCTHTRGVQGVSWRARSRGRWPFVSARNIVVMVWGASHEWGTLPRFGELCSQANEERGNFQISHYLQARFAQQRI